VSGEPQTPGPETSLPYTVIFSRQARRNLHENLPLDAAVAAMEMAEAFDAWRKGRSGRSRAQGLVADPALTMTRSGGAAQHDLERTCVGGPAEHVVGRVELIQREVVGDEPSGVDLVSS
jgi:hypothetical protein